VDSSECPVAEAAQLPRSPRPSSRTASTASATRSPRVSLTSRPGVPAPRARSRAPCHSFCRGAFWQGQKGGQHQVWVFRRGQFDAVAVGSDIADVQATSDRNVSNRVAKLLACASRWLSFHGAQLTRRRKARQLMGGAARAALLIDRGRSNQGFSPLTWILRKAPRPEPCQRHDLRGLPNWWAV
jgi:hypothetical protein